MKIIGNTKAILTIRVKKDIETTRAMEATQNTQNTQNTQTTQTTQTIKN